MLTILLLREVIATLGRMNEEERIKVSVNGRQDTKATIFKNHGGELQDSQTSGSDTIVTQIPSTKPKYLNFLHC